jgi:hypothetical protein
LILLLVAQSPEEPSHELDLLAGLAYRTLRRLQRQLPVLHCEQEAAFEVTTTFRTPGVNLAPLAVKTGTRLREGQLLPFALWLQFHAGERAGVLVPA